MKLIDFINLAIGVPFLDQGRDFQGWDCWGLIRRAYSECFGVELPDLDRCNVLSYEQGRELFDSLAVAYQEIEPGRALSGDVVILRGVPCHAGLVVKPGLMLHVDQKCGTCVELYLSGVWKTRIAGIFRHADFA